MLVDVVTDYATEVLRPAAAEANEPAWRRPRCCSASLEIGLPILGVPESLGGISEERSAMAGTLVAEALGKGDMGLALAALGPGAVATALGPVGHRRRSRRPTCRPSPATTCRSPRWRSPSPPSCSTSLEPATTATRSGDGYVLDGVKSGVVRGADAELFIVGADARRLADAVPRRVRRRGAERRGRPVDGRPRRVADPARPRPGCRCPPRPCWARPTVRRTPSACASRASPGARSRSAPARRSSTTSPTYVNEREAFGEPISHRQAVAFMVANIAIELQSMRLVTYKAASRAAPGKDFSREVALARQLCAEQGHADRPRRRPAARRPRLRQGTPRRAVVPRPACRRHHGRMVLV